MNDAEGVQPLLGDSVLRVTNDVALGEPGVEETGTELSEVQTELLDKLDVLFHVRMEEVTEGMVPDVVVTLNVNEGFGPGLDEAED